MAIIAIIDDNPQSCEIFARLLKLAGHAPVCLMGSEGAIESLEEARPDMLVLDVNLPGINGLELLRRLRKNPVLRDLPVVMLSGVLELEVQTEALRLGAMDYIVKGLDGEAMLKRIERHLPD